MEFYDLTITVAPDKKSAEVNLTLKARVAGERDTIIQELKIWLNKSEGDWRIYRLETVKTLSSSQIPQHDEGSLSLAIVPGEGPLGFRLRTANFLEYLVAGLSRSYKSSVGQIKHSRRSI